MTSEFIMKRRGFMGAVIAGLLVPSTRALALDTGEAKALIGQLVDEINGIINSGKSEAAMYTDFEGIFRKYAFVDGIARTVLGAPARTASNAQMAAFSDAFTGYMARKYGKRFREFIGGWIEVQAARELKSYYEVDTMAKLAGTSPFAVTFRVSDKSGRNQFFDMLIEGISLVKAERSEVGAMLDQERGDINRLTERLKSAS